MSDPSETKLRFLDRRLMVRILWALILSTLIVLATAITCFHLPRQYYSFALLEVKMGTDYCFAYSPAQILTGRSTLYEVMDQLHLADTWSRRTGGSPLSREEACGMLRRSLRIEPIRNTDMLKIGVYSTDRQEAADIANTIVSVYRKIVQKNQMGTRKAVMEALWDNANDQRKKVDQLQGDLQRMRIKYKIVDPAPEAPRETINATDVTTDSTKMQNYLDLKNTYLPELDTYNTMIKGYMLQQQQLTLPLNPAVIWGPAEPALAPSRPAVWPIMTGGILAGGVIFGLLIFGRRRS